MTPESITPSATGSLLELLAADFERRWPSTSQGLEEIHRYALWPMGKLLRPLLVLECALAVGGEPWRVLPAAIGIECCHVGSLMHDDIIDRDELRRGRDAVHRHFGPERALLAGNSMFFQWFQCLCECLDRGVPSAQVAEAMRIQATAALEVCQGADLELAMGGDIHCGLERYREMARLKTAVLLAAACRIGAVLSGASADQVRALTQFGEHLGLAFQFRDDLLPYMAESRTTGKSAFSDLRNRRPTLPLLLAYQVGGAEDRTLIEQLLALQGEPSTELLLGTGDLLLRTDALATAERMAHEEILAAQACLRCLPPGPSRTRLEARALEALVRAR